MIHMEDEKKKKKKITFERVSPVFRHPIRARIMQRLHESPSTIKGLSHAFSIPRQKINYHVKALEDDELIKSTLLDKQLKERVGKDVGYDLTENGKDIATTLDLNIDFRLV